MKTGIYFSTIEIIILSIVILATSFGIYFLGVRTGYVTAEREIAENNIMDSVRYPIKENSQEDPIKNTAVYKRLIEGEEPAVSVSPEAIEVSAIKNQAEVPVEFPDLPVVAKSFNNKPIKGWYVSSSELLNAEEGDLLVERLRSLGFVALLEQPEAGKYGILVGPEDTEILANRLMEQLQKENALSGDLKIKSIS